MTTLFISAVLILYLMFVFVSRLLCVNLAKDEEMGKVLFWLVCVGMLIPVVVMIVRHLEYMGVVI